MKTNAKSAKVSSFLIGFNADWTEVHSATLPTMPEDVIGAVTTVNAYGKTLACLAVAGMALPEPASKGNNPASQLYRLVKRVMDTCKENGTPLAAVVAAYGQSRKAQKDAGEKIRNGGELSPGLLRAALQFAKGPVEEKEAPTPLEAFAAWMDTYADELDAAQVKRANAFKSCL